MGITSAMDITSGPVSVISGASSGFGAIYAERFARRGHNLLLIARRTDRLEKLAAALTGKYGVRAEVMTADLSRAEDLRRAEERIETLSTIEYLVNCAGFGGNRPFPDVDLDLETRMILVHCLASMRLCRAALVPMTAKKSGKIINLASAAEFLAGRGAADYTATKAYMTTFSRSLQADVVDRGIRVQALCPGMVATEFHQTNPMRDAPIKKRIPGFLWIDAEKVVTASLKSIDCRWLRRVVCMPTLRYKILIWAGYEWWLAPLRILFSRGRIR